MKLPIRPVDYQARAAKSWETRRRLMLEGLQRAQENRRLAMLRESRSTPWTRDEHGNLSRQVGDVGG